MDPVDSSQGLSDRSGPSSRCIASKGKPELRIFGDESVPEASDLFCLRAKQGPRRKREIGGSTVSKKPRRHSVGAFQSQPTSA